MIPMDEDLVNVSQGKTAPQKLAGSFNFDFPLGHGQVNQGSAASTVHWSTLRLKAVSLPDSKEFAAERRMISSCCVKSLCSRKTTETVYSPSSMLILVM